MIDESVDTQFDAKERWKRNRYNKDRNTYLKGTYGITLKDYEKIFQKQRKSCAVCGNSRSGNQGKYNTFSVDHDHKTGKVRGLLCMSCNLAVVPTVEYYNWRIKRAYRYLRKHGTLK